MTPYHDSSRAIAQLYINPINLAGYSLDLSTQDSSLNLASRSETLVLGCPLLLFNPLQTLISSWIGYHTSLLLMQIVVACFL